MWTKGLLELALLNEYWGDTRVEYDASNNAIYIGLAKDNGASTSAGNHWKISFLTYDASNNCTRIQKQASFYNWDDRAALSW